MQLVEDDNERWILEQERAVLIENQHRFDLVYGTYVAACVRSLQTLALFAHLLAAALIIYHRKTRTRTNLIVALWSLLNALVLMEGLLRFFAGLANDDIVHFADMMAATARTYGAILAIVWVYSKFLEKPRREFDCLNYMLMMVPLFIYVGFVWYYLNFNEFIYEAFGPGCDVLHVFIYIVVGLTYAFGRILAHTRDSSNYALMVSIVNLLTNFPLCMMTIYLRFNLDIGYTYRFHVWMVDFVITLISCSGSFFVLLMVVFYNDTIKYAFLRSQKIL